MVSVLSPCLQSIMHLFFKTTPCNYNILVASTIPIPFRNNLTHLGNSPWKFKPPSSSIFYLLPKNIFSSCSGEHIVGVETLFYSYEPIFKSKSLRGPPSPSRKKNGRRGNNNILFQPLTHVNSNRTSERLRLLQCCFLIVFIF